ncbi:MAG: SAM-dependent chlorinase/fluorinase [Proteobacteria bacterium]|nr:SAM-dependent chlorinase/fluorinase [Pseudomonadota bacterium]
MTAKNEPFTITVLTDYGPLSDMAFAEVTQSLYDRTKGLDTRIREYSIPAFDTVQTGFMLAQTAINSKLGDRHLFFVNTAPRHDNEKPRKDSAGEKLVYMKLHNGVRIIAVNSGHSLSLVKDAAKEVRIVGVENAGSQFRSRDFYPKILGEIAHDDYRNITKKKPVIADMPENAVGFVDGYGNLKCTIDPATLKKHLGRFVAVEINGHRHFMKVGTSIFDVPDGYLCMAPGSSGWTLPNGKKRAFAEIVRRSGSAFLDFNKPKGGATVKWTAAL